jgi:hypothetical protein
LCDGDVPSWLLRGEVNMSTYRTWITTGFVLVGLVSTYSCGKDSDNDGAKTVSIDRAGASGKDSSDSGAGRGGDSSAAGDSGGRAGDGGKNSELGPDGCFKQPKKHLEIINACTDALALDKPSELNPAGFNDDGELLAPEDLPAL